jgi:hypothetical protein
MARKHNSSSSRTGGTKALSTHATAIAMLTERSSADLLREVTGTGLLVSYTSSRQRRGGLPDPFTAVRLARPTVLQGAPRHGYARPFTCTNTVLTPVGLCAQPLLSRNPVRRSSYVRLALTVQGIADRRVTVAARWRLVCLRGWLFWGTATIRTWSPGRGRTTRLLDRTLTGK